MTTSYDCINYGWVENLCNAENPVRNSIFMVYFAMRKRSPSSSRFLPKGLAVLYEDKDIMVVDKPAGLLTVATEREKERTAHFILTEYFRKGCGRSRKRLFVVHRLDRETTGLLIFAKSEEAKDRLQARWKQTEKKYLAIVHGKCEKTSGTITSYLAEDASYNVYETADRTKGKLAQTAYIVLKETKNFTLLEVALLTGRKNQIRVHLASIGHPIVGDVKYGREDGPPGRMALHARSISIKHPYSGKQLAFEAEVPEFFSTLVGRIDRQSSPPKTSSAPDEAAEPAPLQTIKK
jgi:tRNA pseudouridine32 synthase/23S rRNA pseudouridine746 synthase/23S rRNA pseudouridine1911/1915/1917 synthase